MNRIRLHSALLPLLLAVAFLGTPFGSSPIQDSGVPEGTPQFQSTGMTVYLVRHAEKQEGKNPSLLAVGEERAQDLAHMFAATGVTHVFSTDYLRTQETAAPLAKLAGVEVLPYDGFKLPDLVDDLRQLPQGSVAVVVGHSNTSPQLYSMLGAGHAKGLDDKGNIPDEAFDRIYFTHLRTSPGGVQCVAAHELRYGE